MISHPCPRSSYSLDVRRWATGDNICLRFLLCGTPYLLFNAYFPWHGKRHQPHWRFVHFYPPHYFITLIFNGHTITFLGWCISPQFLYQSYLSSLFSFEYYNIFHLLLFPNLMCDFILEGSWNPRSLKFNWIIFFCF